jgi:hypothetical protein
VYYCIYVYGCIYAYFSYIIEYLRYLCVFLYYISLSFHAENNPDQWYQSRLLLIILSVHVPNEVRV